ncbi:BON domain-containing protein [Salipiger sp. P9]|uniref:OmpA family protein n=1 Tax=Salipiger pentaromativorans TaxID=2943193 RepID=UPI002157805F|nr:OmpA family protein [Salipiger pentaromativorans]MCR8549316.1 BON domain-containing protein [Salipiger pentaromativorans]
MRDFFAIVAIILAVVSLGVFQVPGDNALLDAGIRAEAQGAVYQQKHPIGIAVTRGVVTATGRVESDEERAALIATLAALEGVEGVTDDLTVLPQVAPFTLEIRKGPEGVALAGHVVSEAQGVALQEMLGPSEALVVAAGAPDELWSGVVARAASVLARMLDARLEVEDRALRLSGRVHLPATLDEIRDALADLPEGYDLTLDLAAVDDGLPYRLTVSRDPHMGLRLDGKLPPEFDRAPLAALGAAQEEALVTAPLPLPQPRFEPALAVALPVFAGLKAGQMTVTDTLVSLSGGPVPEAEMAAAEALRGDLPAGVALSLALVPEDDGAPLVLRAEWRGDALLLSGKVPADFPEDAGGAFDVPVQMQDLARSPWPDLTGWNATALAALSALAMLERGALLLSSDGLELSGVAANPEERDRALASVAPDTARIALQDDGTPPAFSLRYDVARGAELTGKLPAGLEPEAMAGALGLTAVDGAPKVSPETSPAPVQEVLEALGRWLPEMDSAVLTLAAGGLSVAVTVRPASDARALEAELRASLPEAVALSVAAPEALPGTGDRRDNVLSGGTEVFAAGVWLPELFFTPTEESCNARFRSVPQVPFARGGFSPLLGSARPLAELTALARACTRFAGLELTVTGHAGSAEIPVLNRQLSRRRAEAVRAILAARGVPAGLIVAQGLGDDGSGDRLGYAVAAPSR